MPFVSSHASRVSGALGRPIVMTLFVASCLLAIVSYYTTQQGMALRERPALARRAPFDELSSLAGRSEQMLIEAHSNGERYVTALEEMAAAEKSIGHISRAQDADPYLNRIREAVAREAQTYAASYREGAGEGVRYTAFDRYAKLTRGSVAEIASARRSLAHNPQSRPISAGHRRRELSRRTRSPRGRRPLRLLLQ